MDLDRLHSILTRVTKPGQYLGNEVNVIKKDFDAAKVRICLIFPDKYEMGMSHVGLKILYEILNRIPDVVCERAYAPEMDMMELLAKEGLPLFSLESKRPLGDFDMLGFSFTYELTYTNFLKILQLSHIPLWQKERSEGFPLIVGGGGSMMNAEPIADFLDAALIGDGEEAVVDFVDALRAWKESKESKAHLLKALTAIEGAYVPSFFEPSYQADGTIREVKPLLEGYKGVKKRVVKEIDNQPYPTNLLVPSVKLIHDRIGIEIQRGCNRACRFCQAGYIDRPVRQRSPENVLRIAEESLKKTGIEEISLLSLSAADYATIVPLMKELNGRYASKKISISVPATRTEKLTPELIEQIKKVRKTGFTVAPEAGSPRMRRVINKGNLTADLYQAVTNAFSAGWDLLKLYYMVGLPFELDEDVVGIANEGNESIKICFQHSPRSELNLSVSSFVPKPHTPFQWEPQMTIDETRRRHDLVKHNLKSKRIRFKHHNPKMSYLEGLLSRGDRRVAKLLELAVNQGCVFDEWEEHFDFGKWQAAFSQWGHDPDFYLHRRKSFDEVLPWDHLFLQMDKTWLWDEFQKAHEAALDGLSEEKKQEVLHVMTHRERRRLNPLPNQLPGFTEDCSVQRCSYCGVCDFKNVKNRIYVVGEEPVVAKKGNREWYGWLPKPASLTVSQPEPELKKQPFKIRFRYSKKEEARFMGHLELMGVIKRAIKRAEIPMAYSEGFHPQMKIAMSHPIPLGLESDWEFFDLEVMQQLDLPKLTKRLQENLPKGVTLLSTEWVDRGGASLYSALREVTYKAYPVGGERWPEDRRAQLESFEHAKNFIWVRQREKGPKEFDLKSLVALDWQSFPEAVTFKTKVGDEGTLSPHEVLAALFGFEKEELSRIRFQKVGIFHQ